MERYHMFKLGLAILFYAAYCIRPMLVSGLRSNNLVTNQTLRPEDYFVFYQGVDGTPGVDFPVLSYIPRTTFSCDGIESGYYADLDTDCQVFHICEEGKKISFLCPNGTIFEQADLICEWWYKVNCTNAPSLYQESAEFLREDLARRKASRRISHEEEARSHGAVMRVEESASVSAQQNGRPYQVTSSRDSRVGGNVNLGRSSSGVAHSNNNLIQSAIDKDVQNIPQKRFNDAETGNFINNVNEDNQGNETPERLSGQRSSRVYVRSTTPASLGGFSSNLGDFSSKKPSKSDRGRIKFSSRFESKTTETPGSTLRINVDEYDLEFPKHKSEITSSNIPLKPTPGTPDKVKIDSSKVNLGLPKQTSTGTLTRNDIINKRLEPLDSSDELQIPQETAAFAPNSYNSLQGNTGKFTSNPHPNHRPTYSDLKRPDFSSTKFVNTINSVTPQYITTQPINSGKPFLGSTVGANVFNKNSGRSRQNNGATIASSTTERSIPFTGLSGISSTFPPFVDKTRSFFSTSQPAFPNTVSQLPDVSSTYQTFYGNSQAFSSTLQPEFSSTLQPDVSSTYQTLSNSNQAFSSTPQPGTTASSQPDDATTNEALDYGNQDFTSTPQPGFSSTASPSFEGSTKRTIDHATVYGSFSKDIPTTAAPQEGVAVKLGKNVDKVNIQLSKSLGGSSARFSSTVAPLRLATDGYVRISGSISQPPSGSGSQVNLGTGSGMNSLSSTLQTGSEVAPALTISGNISPFVGSSGAGVLGSTVIPSILTQSNIQSTTRSPILLETGTIANLENLANTASPSPDVIISENDIGSTAASSSLNASIGIATGSPGNYFSGGGVTSNTVDGKIIPAFSGTETTTPNATPNVEISTGSFGSTVVPNIQGSTGVPLEYNSKTGTISSIGTPVSNIQALAGVSGSIGSSIGGGNVAAGITGSTIFPNVAFTGSIGEGSDSRYNIPSSSVRPGIFINKNSGSTVSPPVRAVSSLSTVSTGAHSQVSELLPISETTDASAIRNNGTDSHVHSYRRPNFYPTRSSFGKSVKPKTASRRPLLQDNYFQSTLSPSTESFTSNILGSSSLSQNEIGSTLSPFRQFSTFAPVTTQNTRGYTAFQSFPTTISPFTGTPVTSNNAFYVTRNSVFSSTPAPPFGLSNATPPSTSIGSTPFVNISPLSNGARSPDITLNPPKLASSVTGDSSLVKSETKYPRPFKKTLNAIDGESSPFKTDTVTPTYLTYKISSARPFELPKNKATPAPTIPTPFTTARSVQENVDSMINALKEIVDNHDYSSETPRPGLIIPPSAGPQTLHTLAQYFANALDGIVAEREKETGEELDKESKEKLTSLLTQMTMYRYNQLFKDAGASSEDITETTTVGTGEELQGDDSNNLVETPELRQLALNFSRALSSYLNDPDSFKKELETFRPTEPSSLGDENTEAVIENEELLNFSDADSKSNFPPLFPTPQSPSPTWGYIVASKHSGDLDVKNSLHPDLHTADTQSFVPGFNNLAAYNGKGLNKGESDSKKDLPGDHWTTSPGVTKLWQSALSINPAILNENLDSTRPISYTTEPYNAPTTPPPLDISHSEIQYDLRSLPPVSLNSTQVHGILIDFVNTTKTDDSNRLQRLLRKLNTTEDEFIHRMKEIESNPLTKRLILLLISECGANVTSDLHLDSTQSLSEGPASSSSNSVVVTHGESRTVNSDVPILVDPSLQEDDQDTRALQLLNSLYSIASKFGK